jgi:endonuclease G
VDRTYSVSMFDLLAEAARSVAYLEVTFGGGQRAEGTGFLIGPDLLLTNHHNVIHEQYGAATAVTADFDKQEGFYGVPRVVPGILPPRGTSAEHDWAVIRLQQPVADSEPIALGTPWAVSANDAVIIVQHPLGGYKRVAIDAQSLQFVDDDIIRYLADTQKGSSGSPVFNTRLHCIALHHAESEVVAGDGEGDEKLWSNEGIRIERVMEGLDAAGIPYESNAEAYIARLRARTHVAPGQASSLYALSDDPEAFIARLKVLLQETQPTARPLTGWHWVVAGMLFVSLVAVALLAAVWWSKLPITQRDVLGNALILVAVGSLAAFMLAAAYFRQGFRLAWDRAAQSAPMKGLLLAGCALLVISASAVAIPALTSESAPPVTVAVPPVASGMLNIAVTSLVQDSSAANKELTDKIARSLNTKLGGYARASAYPDASPGVGKPMEQWARDHDAHLLLYGYGETAAGEIVIRPELWVSRDFGLGEELTGNHVFAMDFTVAWPPPDEPLSVDLEKGVTLLAQLAMGISYLRRESPDAAVRYFEGALDQAQGMELSGDELALFDLFLGSALMRRNQPGDLGEARARFESALLAQASAARAQIGLANIRYVEGLFACPRDETTLLDAVNLYREACVLALADDASATDLASARAGDCPLIPSQFLDVSAKARIGEGQAYNMLAWCYRDTPECWEPLLTSADSQFLEVKRVYESDRTLYYGLKEPAAYAYLGLGLVDQAFGRYPAAADAYVTAISESGQHYVQDIASIKLSQVCAPSLYLRFIASDRDLWRRSCASRPPTPTPDLEAAPGCTITTCAGNASACPSTPPPITAATPVALKQTGGAQ